MEVSEQVQVLQRNKDDPLPSRELSVSVKENQDWKKVFPQYKGSPI